MTQYRIIRTAAYRRDIKRLKRADKDIHKLDRVVDLLASGKELPAICRNHKLKGDLAGFEECHIQGDWLLMYEKRRDVLILVLTRTGLHSELFGD